MMDMMDMTKLLCFIISEVCVIILLYLNLKD